MPAIELKNQSPTPQPVGKQRQFLKDGIVDSKDVAHFALFFGKSRMPNILLIIADDVGMDLTTGMYPGLIADLLDLYGPSRHDHPDYLNIDGRPASTPVLDSLAHQGMVFSNTWAQSFCSPTQRPCLL